MNSIPIEDLSVGEVYSMHVNPKYTELIGESDLHNITVCLYETNNAEVELVKTDGSLWESIYSSRFGGPKKILIMSKRDYNSRWGLRYVS